MRLQGCKIPVPSSHHHLIVNLLAIVPTTEEASQHCNYKPKDPQWIDNSSLYASKEELDAIKSQVLQSYENDLKASGNYVPKQDDWGSSELAGFKSPKKTFRTIYSTDGP